MCRLAVSTPTSSSLHPPPQTPKLSLSASHSQTQKHYRALRCFLSPLAARRPDGSPPRVDVPLTDDAGLLAAIDTHMLQGFTSDEFGTWPDIVVG